MYAFFESPEQLSNYSYENLKLPYINPKFKDWDYIIISDVIF